MGLYSVAAKSKGWKIFGDLSEGTAAFAGWMWGQFQCARDSPTLATPAEGLATPKSVCARDRVLVHQLSLSGLTT